LIGYLAIQINPIISKKLNIFILLNQMKNKTYKSKQNDSIIRVFYDDIIQELHIKIIGDTSWIVIGYKDLQKALSLVDIKK
jgi:hypothetical protein